MCSFRSLYGVIICLSNHAPVHEPASCPELPDMILRRSLPDSDPCYSLEREGNVFIPRSPGESRGGSHADSPHTSGQMRLALAKVPRALLLLQTAYLQTLLDA